jgi:hypothetical protein
VNVAVSLVVVAAAHEIACILGLPLTEGVMTAGHTLRQTVNSGGVKTSKSKKKGVKNKDTGAEKERSPFEGKEGWRDGEERGKCGRRRGVEQEYNRRAAGNVRAIERHTIVRTPDIPVHKQYHQRMCKTNLNINLSTELSMYRNK